jgi:hypothetical protein
MRDVFRSLLAATVVAWAASCSLDDHDLGANAGHSTSGAAGHVAGAAGATSMGAAGAAGTTPDTSGAAGALPVTGAAGTSPTGAAGDSSTAGAPAGAAGSGGAAGSPSTAGAAGTSSTDGAAGASGAAGSGSAGGAGGSSSAGGSGAAGNGAVSTVGCSDGTREGFTEISKHPGIAACAGAWDEPGLISSSATSPQCARKSGNSGAITDGQGCSAADLCAAGWHVCDSAQSLTDVSGGCNDAIAPSNSTGALVFFATAQRAQAQVCTTNGQGANNVYGCGTFGSTPDHSCQPLDRFLHDSDCVNNAPWSCSNGPIGTSQTELDDITKSGPSHGGVLCCKT